MTPSDCSPKSVRLVPPPVAVAVLGVLVAPRPLPARARRAVPRLRVSAQEAKRTERRAEVKKLANKGWSNQRIAEKLGSTPATVKKDVDWLTANEGYERPAVIPKRG